jgi:hypothetical protein
MIAEKIVGQHNMAVCPLPTVIIGEDTLAQIDSFLVVPGLNMKIGELVTGA